MNDTQLVGIAAFVAGAVACAWRRWPFPALVFGLGALEVALGLRHSLHDLVEGDVVPKIVPLADKRMFQAALIAVAGIAGAILLWRFARGTDGTARARRVALVLLGLTAIETISLHAIDHILYAPLGPVKLIGWLWLALALWAIAVAVRPGRSRR